MKKIALIPLVFAFVLGLSFTSYANTGHNTAGQTLTISDNDADFTFDPSPNVYLGYNIDNNGETFAINTYNDVTSTDTGMEYGMASDFTGYYQRQKAETPLANPNADDKSAFSDWTAIGGGGGS